MKRILISLSIIGAAAAIAIGATTAFFSDTETSTGNTFTAGSIDLTVSSHGSATEGACTFEQTEGDPIFNCTDVKPGDSGESTIKFNLQNNPAWGCVYVTSVIDSDNTCVEPEIDSNDPQCDNANDIGTGELDNALLLTVWVDDGAGSGSGGIACDDKINGTEDVLARNTPLSTFMSQVGGQTSFVLPVSIPNGSMMNEPLQPGDHCLGIAWNIPNGTGNDVQTDKLSGNLRFYVEQSRNNASFVCPPLL